MSILTHPLQHIYGKDHDRQLRRSWKHCQHRRQRKTITNLRFADDIDGLAGEEEELAKLVQRLNKASAAYSMEISAEKTKLMTNNSSGINTEIKVNGQKLETVTSFKYLGSVITDEGSKPEILSRLAQATAALTRLKPIWIDKSISLSSKLRLMPLSHPSSCMLVNHGPSQQSSKEEYKPWKWGATARYYTSHTKTMLPSPCQDPAGNWTTWRSPDDRKKTQTAVVWSCFPFIRSGQNRLARHSERGKKTRQTEEEVRRQH